MTHVLCLDLGTGTRVYYAIGHQALSPFLDRIPHASGCPLDAVWHATIPGLHIPPGAVPPTGVCTLGTVDAYGWVTWHPPCPCPPPPPPPAAGTHDRQNTEEGGPR